MNSHKSIDGLIMGVSNQQQQQNGNNCERPMYQKRHRTTFNQYQLGVLEEAFKQNSYPSPLIRDALANKTTLDSSRIQVWFQNRRAKHKKQVSQAMRCFAASASTNHQHQANNHHHHHQSIISSVASQMNVEHCVALQQQQQQMALDLHLSSNNLQQPASPSNLQAGGSTFLDQHQQVAYGEPAASQLLSCAATDLQLNSDDSQNNNNLPIYNNHNWLNSCDHINLNQQQQQQQQSHATNNQHLESNQTLGASSLVGSINQQLVQHSVANQNNCQQQTIANSTSPAASSSSSSSSSNSTQDSLNSLAPSLELAANFNHHHHHHHNHHHHQRQYQLRQHNHQVLNQNTTNQCFNYYKHIGSLRSTVKYLH